MSVKIRPITEADKKIITPNKNSAVTEAPFGRLEARNSNIQGSVLSDHIFGYDPRRDSESNKDYAYEDRYTRVGYIDLPRRVLNQFLAGRKAPIWRRILGLKEDEIAKIINCDVLYDTVNNIEIPIDKIGNETFPMNERRQVEFDESNLSCPRYIYGADYLIYLLANTDIEHRIRKALVETYVFPVLGKKRVVEEIGEDFIIENCIEEVNVDIQFMNDFFNYEELRWIYGNYILNLDPIGFTEEQKEAYYARLYDVTYNNLGYDVEQFPYLSVLLKIKRDGIGVLMSQIMSYVYLLPIGFRPSIDNRVDRLSIQYNNLISCVREFEDSLNSVTSTFNTITRHYKKMVAIIRHIFITEPTMLHTPKERKEYKSLSDMLTGKEGLIRDRMEGARVDYSGRAVITCDPNMPIDTIGVPKKILKKIAEPLMMKTLRSDAEKNPWLAGFKNQNLSRFSTVGTVPTSTVTYDEYMEYWFKQADRYAVTGRQPTLYYLGIEGFKVVPVEGNAIVLSPLVVMPFNADFDGDQMHINMPTTWQSLTEIKQNMSFKNNIHYPKNGEITVVTRHEIVYGLWMALMKADSKPGRNISDNEINDLASKFTSISNIGLYNKIYELVCRQEINIYDTVASVGKKAGIIAFDYAVTNAASYSPKRIMKRDANGKEVKTYQTINGGSDYIYQYNNSKSKPKLSSYITDLIISQTNNNVDAFLSAINRLVRLGFSVAKIWPPNISTIIDASITQHVQSMIKDFNMRTAEHEKLMNCGIELESEYTVYFSDEYDKLKKAVTNYLLEHLDQDSGYLTMMLSGGKGDKDNILQIFGMKGRIEKNDTSAFNCIVSGCYSDQLTGLEHFITAYGSRKGIADKVLATAEPGYMSRKLEHCGAPVVITNEDCGTREGLAIYVSDVVPFLDESQISLHGTNPSSASEYDSFYKLDDVQAQLRAATHYIIPVLMGRYCVLPDGNEEFIDTVEKAEEIVAACWGSYNSDGEFVPAYMWYDFMDEDTGKPIDKSNINNIPEMFHDIPIVMRSPIYCARPCCQKCYGIDLTKGSLKTNRRLPKIGRGVGFIAAQSIGEPGTQMTMKNFQKGGVVTESNLTSSFELIEDYLELHNFANKKKNKRNIISYDALSPVEGYVKVQHLGNGSKRILVTKTASSSDLKNLIPGTHKIIVHESTRLKDYVKVGDSFQLIQGNLDMHEVLRYRGYDKAVTYLTLMLYNIFQSQEVNCKHFEVIVSAMSYAYILTDTEANTSGSSISYGKGSKFPAGSLVSRQENAYAINGSAIGGYTLLGLKALPKYRSDFFEGMFMENMDSYVPRSILMNPNDSMSDPIIRAAFGLPINIGTDLETKK